MPGHGGVEGGGPGGVNGGPANGGRGGGRNGLRLGGAKWGRPLCTATCTDSCEPPDGERVTGVSEVSIDCAEAKLEAVAALLVVVKPPKGLIENRLSGCTLKGLNPRESTLSLRRAFVALF